MESVLASLGTLLLIGFAGYCARRTGAIGEDGGRGLSGFIYHIALPALFFVETARMSLGAHDLWIAIGSLAPIALVLSLLGLARLSGLLDRERFALAGLAVVFGSNAFFGLAFFRAFYGEDALADPILAATLLGLVGVVGSELLFAYATAAERPARSVLRVALSPILLAAAAGLLAGLLPWRPGFVFSGLGMLGQTAPTLAVFVLGVFIHDHLERERLLAAAVLAALRIVALPLAGLAVILPWRGAYGDAAEFLVLQTGVPAAVAVAIFAQRYRFAIGTLTGMVALSSLASFPLLFLLYLLGRGLGFGG
ncbi:MAG: AEC family transporter [Planctomycetota bacterium]